MKKKVLIIGAAVATTVLAGGWALAQVSGHGPEGMGSGGMHGMHGQVGLRMHGQMGPGMRGQIGSDMQGGPGLTPFDSSQIEALKSELSITAAQEAAWSKYATVVQDAATTMSATRGGINPDAVSKMTPQDRFAFVSKMREQGQKQLETVTTAANELLAALDDAQKIKARDILPGLATLGPGMHGAMAGPRHGH